MHVYLTWDRCDTCNAIAQFAVYDEVEVVEHKACTVHLGAVALKILANQVPINGAATDTK